jgi:hypothetical protein
VLPLPLASLSDSSRPGATQLPSAATLMTTPFACGTAAPAGFSALPLGVLPKSALPGAAEKVGGDNPAPEMAPKL